MFGLISGNNYLKIFDKPRRATDPCYSDVGHRPTKCVPDFINAAYGRQVEVSSTCGSPPSRLCASKFVDGSLKRTCHYCDASDPSRSHPPAYLTDLNNPNNLTCWHSRPMSSDEPENVTLTLSLGKKYELTYINLQFCTEKPDSLSIHKSTDYGRAWQPFQYFSSDCQDLFEMPKRLKISKLDEQEALCTDSHLTIRQGAHGMANSRVGFSTLEGRPSAHILDASPVLQDWVTATDIRVVLYRPKGGTDSLVSTFSRMDPKKVTNNSNK